MVVNLASEGRRWPVRLSVVVALSLGMVGCPEDKTEELLMNNVAQEWMVLAKTCMGVNESPTIDARTSFHLAATMYEAWAAYDETASGYFTGHRLKQPPEKRTMRNVHETLSHAVYLVMKERFKDLPNFSDRGREVFDEMGHHMEDDGYIVNGEIVESEAQALGARIAEVVLRYAATDGANEEQGYADTSGYQLSNPLFLSEEPGTNGMVDPNKYQEVIPVGDPVRPVPYLTPHWGEVKGFSLGAFNPDAVRFPVPEPPRLGTATHQQYIDDIVELIEIFSLYDPTVGGGAEMIDLSPALRGVDTIGIIYDSMGHPINPYTNEPYENFEVPLGDYLRVLALYHDGLNHSSPPPWWMEVASDLARGSGVVTDRPANKHNQYDLEYDVKLFFMVTAAVHDAAINSWDIKRRTETARPISQIRYLDEHGMLPVIDDLIEVIEEGDPLAGDNDEWVGRYKIFSWAGPNQGVQWIRAAEWRPYQPLEFCFPPFPAYNSGHTNMSRAAAEAFTAFTGDPFFPEGLAKFEVTELRGFENNLSTPVTLQWATYYDLADETAFARLVTGVHVRADLETGRPTGEIVGQLAVEKAFDYFDGRGVAVGKSILEKVLEEEKAAR